MHSFFGPPEASKGQVNWNITSLDLKLLKITRPKAHMVCPLKNRRKITKKERIEFPNDPCLGDMSVLGKNVMNRNHQLTHLTFKRVLGVDSLVGTIQRSSSDVICLMFAMEKHGGHLNENISHLT